uniref:ubiquitinyl hydrolase 1 n=1 Tax=Cajanus cajan TaxID=3821 RepID=A0A151U2S6_CAJCA|nr:Ubiquitin carboxyl-terminal hydrolase 13 [Cajanus cajan]
MLVPHSDLPQGPQPMEAAAQAENTTTADAPTVDDTPSARFTWTIDNFSRMPKKVYSDIFCVGGYKWRILIFPRGNSVDHLSMYVDVADSATLPYGWSRYAQFNLTVVNQIHSKYSYRKESQHQFNARESDWGFVNFMPLAELYDPARGYLVNDTCIVEADIAVRKDINYWSHDSKKETGYVGLKNQGATCYMNSLLQTLYHISYFRKAVYHMPTTENDMPSGSIPLALQSLFYKLQYSDTSVATKELTKSFGWDTYDSFMQHDVQELNRVLCEKLEDKMKGTVVEGAIQKLFEGHHMNYIECINVDYKSTRKESFYDLQLDVKGCKDVYASFDKYVEVERLEGDNKYHAEHYGLQDFHILGWLFSYKMIMDARKGVLFIDFPPVLQLQLKRFEYDFARDTMVKINDRYEFPLQLDLDRDNGKYLSPEADRSIRNLYTLHSVLVHSSGVHGGHYYAYIRPTLSNQWFKFEDERVTKEDTKRALEEQYGGEEELPHSNPGFNNSPFKFTKYSNAYMLVYIRESDKDNIICNVDEKDIAEHLRIRLRKEHEEKEMKRKEKAEAHLYTIIKVARDEDLLDQIGKDIFFDLVDHDKVQSFRIQKQMPLTVFKEEIAKEFGIPIQYQRFWLWAKRQNHTYRPNKALTPQEEEQSVGLLREVSNKANNVELKLFLEIEMGQDMQPIPPPEKSKENLLLFFKIYEPSNEKLRYAGRLFVMSSGKPVDILVKLNEMAGYASDEELELFEEIKFEPHVMCERVDKLSTFRDSQLEDGDIICFQKSPQSGSGEQYRYPDVPSFLEYVHNRLVVRFRILEKPKEDEFSLELSKLDTYDDVVEKVAQHIGLNDPSKIRLTSHNCYSQQPKPQSIKFRGVEHLSDMLFHYNQISDILYYEVLDIPLPELQCLKTLKIAFHHATKDEVVNHTIRLPKHSTVSDVINDLKSKCICNRLLSLLDSVISGSHCPRLLICNTHNKLHRFFIQKLSKLIEFSLSLSHKEMEWWKTWFQVINILDMQRDWRDILRIYSIAVSIVFVVVFFSGGGDCNENGKTELKSELTVLEAEEGRDVDKEEDSGAAYCTVEGATNILIFFYYYYFNILLPAKLALHIILHFTTFILNFFLLQIPEEEKNLGPHDRLIHVYHFLKDNTENQQVQNFGHPFLLAIHEGETLAEVKLRIQKKLQVPDDEFSKWNFAFVSFGRPEYLQDIDIVSTRFQRRDVYGAWEQYLGLEHTDNTPRRSFAANQNRHAYEKPVKIND